MSIIKINAITVDADSGDAPRRPVGVSSELWSYVVAGGSDPRD